MTIENPYGPPGLTQLSVLMRPVGSGVPEGVGVFRRDSSDAVPRLVAYVTIAEFDRIAAEIEAMRSERAGGTPTS